MRWRRTVWIVGLAVLSGGAFAQGDPQTEDHERRDKKYLDRMLDRNEKDPQGPSATFDRDSFLAKAEELIRDRNYDAKRSAHYRLQTDDPRVDLDATLGLLESFRAFFDGSAAAGDAGHAAKREPARVFLFASFYKYNQLLAADFRFSTVRPRGHYVVGFDAIVAHAGAADAENFADTLVHEAAHERIRSRLFAGDDAPSPWLSEGLAAYFGYTFMDKEGVFREGVVGGKRTELLRDAPRSRGGEALRRIQAVRAELRSRAKAPPSRLTEGVLEMVRPDEFYSGDPDLNYGTAWLVVHYLLHGAGEAGREGFLRYIELEARGAGGADVLYELLGLKPGELDAAVAAHLRAIRTR